MIDRQASIALLREELEQQRTRAEAAEAELRELRRVVDAWQAADKAMREIRFGTSDGKHGAKLTAALEAAKEALRHA
jgi:lysylphosphatidylglycerol synthetase-like protein (DUF2156 family)